MATGTTANAAYRRDEVIAEAFRKVRAQTQDGSYTLQQVDNAVKALNKILRKEDLRGVTQNVHMWALSEGTLILSAGVHIYTPDTTNILDIVSLTFRSTDGADAPVDLISPSQYGYVEDKNEAGDPTKVYFKRNQALASQQFYVPVAPSSVTAGSVVTGTDSLNYTCILKHVAATANRPITGSNYQLYWKQTGSGGSTWVSGTTYTNGQLLSYVYKRPLFDFDSPTDNPDMPLGWEDYLIYQLAYDLAPDYGLDLRERDWLGARAKRARDELFPSSRAVVTDIHNKGLYY